MGRKIGLCFVSHEAHLSMQDLFLFLDPSLFIESVSEISYFQVHDLMKFDLSLFIILYMLDHLRWTQYLQHCSTW